MADKNLSVDKKIFDGDKIFDWQAKRLRRETLSFRNVDECNSYGVVTNSRRTFGKSLSIFAVNLLQFSVCRAELGAKKLIEQTAKNFGRSG